jgi:predicted O-methyltransferase YrrM
MLDDAAIPYPKIDLDRVTNPIPGILAAPEFAAADRYFMNSPENHRSLISARTHAVIHALIRNQRPGHVVEIGTYHGGTTETMARAVLANGAGGVHTVSPFDAEAFTPIYQQWPPELQRVVEFHPVDSMAFYMEMDRRGIRPDLVFIDGDHSYEFALFDMLCAARRLTPGGFVIIDDSIQAGPYFAAQDFLAAHPDWIDCTGPNPVPRDRTLAFDPNRTPVPETELIVLRAPAGYRLIDSRPRTFGEASWVGSKVHGVTLALDGDQTAGMVHVQCILCGFGNELPPTQVMANGSAPVEPGQRTVELRLSPPGVIEPARERHTLETWVIWLGRGPLCLEVLPTPRSLNGF